MEDNIILRLKEAFPVLSEAEITVAPRRIFLNVPESAFMDIMWFVFTEMGFTHLCTITGLDIGGRFEFIYHVSNQDGIILNIKYQTHGVDDVVIPSVLPIYQGAVFYERELSGLFGIKVNGLPPGRQYPLPDNWPVGQYPMRKDWAPENLEGKHEQDNGSVGAAASRVGGAGKL